MSVYKIVIATHKKYILPFNSELYYPIQSGAYFADDIGYQRDNEGDNISHKNREYNELCVMYWAWKNLNADFLGIVHYRRHFQSSYFSNKKASVENCIDKDELVELFKTYDVLLPKKNRYPINIEQHYIHSCAGNKEMLKEDLASLRKAISLQKPEYINSLENVLKGHSAHMYHMCVMKRKYYDDYCEFMFSVIDKIEEIRGNRNPSDRYIGGLSEFLLDVWLDKQNVSVKELPLLELEKESYYKRLLRVAKRMIFKDEKIWDEKRIGRTKQ